MIPKKWKKVCSEFPSSLSLLRLQVWPAEFAWNTKITIFFSNWICTDIPVKAWSLCKSQMHHWLNGLRSDALAIKKRGKNKPQYLLRNLSICTSELEWLTNLCERLKVLLKCVCSISYTHTRLFVFSNLTPYAFAKLCDMIM